MNGIVLEVKDKYCVVMDQGGRLVKVNTATGINVGEEIELTNRPTFSVPRVMPAIAAAAVLVLMLFSGLGAYMYYHPITYVNIDINPGIELSVNRFDRVISAYGINDSGKEFIGKLSFKNYKVDLAVNDIIAIAQEDKYLSEGQENALVMTVTSDDKASAEQMLVELNTTVEQQLQTKHIASEVITKTIEKKEHDDAVKKGVSPGKLEIINKLTDIDKTMTFEKCKDMPIRELVKGIKIADKKNNNVTNIGGEQTTQNKHDKATAPGQNKHDKATAPDQNKHHKATAPDQNKHDKATAPGPNKQDKATAPGQSKQDNDKAKQGQE